MNRQFLSGMDNFLLVLQRKVDQQRGAGFISHFQLLLNDKPNTEKLNELIQSNPLINQLNRFYVHCPSLGKPFWKKGTEKNTRIIHCQATQKDMWPSIRNKTVDIKKGELLFFHLIEHPNKQFSVVLSWHHVLMDGYGAKLLLEHLFEGTPVKLSAIEEKNTVYTLWQHLVEAKDYLKDTTKGALHGSFLKGKATQTPQINILNFNPTEYAHIQKNLRVSNVAFFESLWYLGEIGIEVANMLKKKGSLSGDLWVPLPMEMRKKGAMGPVLGNHYSFAFYRIKTRLMENAAQLKSDLLAQLKTQMKVKMPKKYANMVNLLRYMPHVLYQKLITRPNGENISGFVFSMSPAWSPSIKILGKKVQETLALPPDTTPPGLAFQWVKQEQSAQLVVQYNEAMYASEEIQNMCVQLKNRLINHG